MAKKKSDSVVFAFGRFNPITIGHEKLVSKISNEASKLKADARIYTSQTQDKKRNPLSYDQKIHFMKSAFSSLVDVVNDKSTKTIFNVIDSLIEEGYDNIFIVAGEDRIKDFEYMVRNLDQIKVISAGVRDPESQGARGASASKMRSFAANGDFDAFLKNAPSKLSKNDIELMFNQVRSGMQLKEGYKPLYHYDDILVCEGDVVWDEICGIVGYLKEENRTEFIIEVVKSENPQYCEGMLYRGDKAHFAVFPDDMIGPSFDSNLRELIESVSEIKKSLLVENSIVNTHMEHIEDGPLLDGANGVKRSLESLGGVYDMVASKSKGKSNLTLKLDGSPSVICGEDPENGKFFVATKSIFNKTPKINYTNADIEANHPGGAGEKLKVALSELKSLGIKTIVQGDMMFDESLKKVQDIDGVKCVTFKPNTIMYAVPVDSDLGKKMTEAKFGIVFHTTYKGNTISELSAEFGADVSNFKKSKTAWIDDADIKDLSGTASWTEAESKEFKQYCQKAWELTEKNKSFFKWLDKNKEIKLRVSTFENENIRSGIPIKSSNDMFDEFVAHIRDIFSKKQAKLKTDAAREKSINSMNEAISDLKKQKKGFLYLFAIQQNLQDAKLMAIKKLNHIGRMSTFVETSNGFEVTGQEGYVIINNNGAFKLVDRLEFSRYNFILPKNWD